jgi:YidC/Oxa1 family membrane protein insertase
MNRRLVRIIVPLIVAALAGLVVLTMFMSKPKSPTQPQTQSVPATSPASSAPPPQPSEAPPTAPPETPPATAPAATAPAVAAAPPATQPLAHLRAIPASNEPNPPKPASLGSLDPRVAQIQLDLSYTGAGISAIPFADIWDSAAAARKARAYLESLPPDAPIDLSSLDEAQRNILQTAKTLAWQFGGQSGASLITILAAHSIIVNGVEVKFLNEPWSQTAPGTFESSIVDGDGRERIHITRRYILGAAFDITVQTRVRNVTDEPLDVRWRQYGPIELGLGGSRYIDSRRFSFGYLPDPKRLPTLVLADTDNMAIDHATAFNRFDKAKAVAPQQKDELLTIWPNKDSLAKGYDLSWLSTTNRYFAMAIHPAVSESAVVTPSLKDVVESIRIDVSGADKMESVVFTFLTSPQRTLQPDEEWPLDMGVYAGPLDPHVLDRPPYKALNMDGMILYRMSEFCAFCTFQWLAQGLLWFLSALHAVLFDWGLAIMGLVLVVRLLLHPITKKSQINMQRFGKQMSAMKPEIEKIQKKYAADPKKAQQEQMRLMREHGVNPMQMLGCLPMFLQMPIWIALYAMLYFAFDLRQQPAFYGVFQLFGGWPFLADLSSEDNFIPLGAGFTIPLIGWHLSSINLLPLLLGFVFFIQQKYMTPPPSPTMTKEQLQQQQIMKWMMVLLFPLMMYKVSCGLTLYIFTSTCFGIMESKYIRSHIDQMDLARRPAGAANEFAAGGAAGSPRPEAAKKPKDPIARAWAERLERARAKREEKQQRSFKKRK